MKHSEKPLTPKQRQYLTLTLARKGYRRTGAADTDESFDQWRHRHAIAATATPRSPGVTISQATQAHFNALNLHFRVLAGEATLEDAGTDPNRLRQINHAITQLAAALGYGPEYLAGICRRVNHGPRTWDSAEDAQRVLNALRYDQRRKQRATQAKETQP